MHNRSVFYCKFSEIKIIIIFKNILREPKKNEETDASEESPNFSFDAFSFDTASWNWDFRKRRSGDFVPNPKLGRVVELVRKRRYLNQVFVM